MFQFIIDNWWKVVILAVVGSGIVWIVLSAVVFFLQKAKQSGVDEIEGAGFKIDFEDKPK